MVFAGACLSRPPTLEPGTHAPLFTREARIGSERIELQLVRPSRRAIQGPLILFATGDGGWRSADRGLFQHLALWGYATAGFSSGHYLRHLGFEATTPAHVAQDYRELIAFAKRALELPAAATTVLVGFSRGSGLAVVAAGQAELHPQLSGVLAVALTEEEEHVRDDRTPARADHRNPSDRKLARMRPYEQLAGLGGLPLAVIQSTRDSYLPAAEARRLFGPDSDRRRFYAVRADSHTFAGAREALFEQARSALEWILARGPHEGPVSNGAP